MDVLGLLAHLKGKASYQPSYFGSHEVSPERAVMALGLPVRLQATTGGDAESVRLGLPTALQRTRNAANAPPC
jgi:hypothetical protein